MSIPVWMSCGVRIVARRCSDGKEVRLIVPSWRPGFAIVMVLVSRDGREVKEQKLMALTGRLWRSQGWCLSVQLSSMGRMLERVVSSASRSCQMLSLLSRPCL